jgi:phage shock protein A
MSTGSWMALTVIVGPVLIFITYLLSRRQQTENTLATIMSTQVASALSTTETMKGLLSPLETEISNMREEIITLRKHINVLEKQILELGHQPYEYHLDWTP